eukprot:GCRY01002389.1.p1 GENE.GCRY01002389.1~~GCRY01002389.1.p1  ORF type:complete len:234 (+),score=20.52 GCRY01002389.1:113-814(+)
MLFLSFWVTTVTIIMYISPYREIKNIIVKKESGELNPLPFFFILLNSLLSLNYGYLVSNGTIQLINIIGILVQIAFILIYFHFGTQTQKTDILKKGARTVGAFLILAIYVNYYVRFSSHEIAKGSFQGHCELCILHLGCILFLTNILVFAAPLSRLKKHIKEKSMVGVPFDLSLFSFITAVSWVVFGLSLSDMVIILPNFCGLILSGIQLFLFYIYGIPTPKSRKEGAILTCA